MQKLEIQRTVTSHKKYSPKIALGCAILLASALPYRTMALVELPSGRIVLNTSLTGTYDSYMIGTVNHNPDYYATFSPVLSYQHNIGPTNLRTYVGLAVNRYNTNTRFDSEDLSAGINFNLPVSEGSRLSGRFGASYTESTQIDPILNDRVGLKSVQFDFGGSYRTSLKTTLSDSVGYTRNQREFFSDQITDPNQGKSYGNQTISSNHLTFSYTDFLEDTNLNLSHTYTRTQSTVGDPYAYDQELRGNIPDVPLDQTANMFGVGVAHPIYGRIIGEVVYGYMIMRRKARETNPLITDNRTIDDRSSSISLNITGPLLPPERFPKVESSASISYQQSASRGLNDSGSKSVVGDAHLSWNARERTRLSLGVSRSQSLGSNNFSVANTGINAGVTESIGMATKLSGNVSYTWRTYRGISRNDSVLDAGVSLQHSLTQHWSIGGNYTFQSNNTDTPPNSFQASRFRLESYTRHVVAGTISCVY